MTIAPPSYVLDADVFMAAARGYYPLDLAPKFWKELVRFASVGRLRSIDKIWDDIEKGQDDLTEWAAREFRQWFDSTNQDDVLGSYRQVMRWAEAQTQFTRAAKAEFAASSDGWLVAYAHAKRFVVATNETFEPAAKRKIKIPNACGAFSVRYVDTFDMIRELPIVLT